MLDPSQQQQAGSWRPLRRAAGRRSEASGGEIGERRNVGPYPTLNKINVAKG